MNPLLKQSGSDELVFYLKELSQKKITNQLGLYTFLQQNKSSNLLPLFQNLYQTSFRPNDSRIAHENLKKKFFQPKHDGAIPDEYVQLLIHSRIIFRGDEGIYAYSHFDRSIRKKPYIDLSFAELCFLVVTKRFFHSYTISSERAVTTQYSASLIDFFASGKSHIVFVPDYTKMKFDGEYLEKTYIHIAKKLHDASLIFFNEGKTDSLPIHDRIWSAFQQSMASYRHPFPSLEEAIAPIPTTSTTDLAKTAHLLLQEIQALLSIELPILMHGGAIEVKSPVSSAISAEMDKGTAKRTFDSINKNRMESGRPKLLYFLLREYLLFTYVNQEQNRIITLGKLPDEDKESNSGPIYTIDHSSQKFHFFLSGLIGNGFDLNPHVSHLKEMLLYDIQNDYCADLLDRNISLGSFHIEITEGFIDYLKELKNYFIHQPSLAFSMEHRPTRSLGLLQTILEDELHKNLVQREKIHRQIDSMHLQSSQEADQLLQANMETLQLMDTQELLYSYLAAGGTLYIRIIRKGDCWVRDELENHIQPIDQEQTIVEVEQKSPFPLLFKPASIFIPGIANRDASKWDHFFDHPKMFFLGSTYSMASFNQNVVSNYLSLYKKFTISSFFKDNSKLNSILKAEKRTFHSGDELAYKQRERYYRECSILPSVTSKIHLSNILSDWIAIYREAKKELIESEDETNLEDYLKDNYLYTENEIHFLNEIDKKISISIKLNSQKIANNIEIIYQSKKDDVAKLKELALKIEQLIISDATAQSLPHLFEELNTNIETLLKQDYDEGGKYDLFKNLRYSQNNIADKINSYANRLKYFNGLINKYVLLFTHNFYTAKEEVLRYQNDDRKISEWIQTIAASTGSINQLNPIITLAIGQERKKLIQSFLAVVDDRKGQTLQHLAEEYLKKAAAPHGREVIKHDFLRYLNGFLHELGIAFPKIVDIYLLKGAKESFIEFLILYLAQQATIPPKKNEIHSEALLLPGGNHTKDAPHPLFDPRYQHRDKNIQRLIDQITSSLEQRAIPATYHAMGVILDAASGCNSLHEAIKMYKEFKHHHHVHKGDPSLSPAMIIPEMESGNVIALPEQAKELVVKLANEGNMVELGALIENLQRQLKDVFDPQWKRRSATTASTR